MEMNNIITLKWCMTQLSKASVVINQHLEQCDPSEALFTSKLHKNCKLDLISGSTYIRDNEKYAIAVLYFQD
jgi:hypothetical protein